MRDNRVTFSTPLVDENGHPVPDVEIEARRQEPHKNGVPTTDFQTTKVTTDANGRWVYPYVPKNYETVGFTLTCSNYMVTMGSVVTGKPESAEAVLVIKRGRSQTSNSRCRY